MKIVTTVKDGQSFVAEPVYLEPKPESFIEWVIRTHFGREPPSRIFSHYERVRLRWMKPGPDGKLVPR